MADAHKNFAYTTVATAPSPATSGTSLVVASGDGALFPATPFNATVWPAGVQPSAANAEIVRVTNIATDTFTLTRAQEGTSARSIVVGDQIMAGVTAKTLTDAESLKQSYVGYNTVGGTTEAITGYKQVLKKITLANDCLLNSVDFYCHGDGSHVNFAGAAVRADNSNSPGYVIAFSGYGEDSSDVAFNLNIALETTPRWLSFGLATWLTAGDYWIQLSVINQTVTLYYDGSGSDYEGTETASWINAIGSAGSRKYSLRASIIQ